jgi:hypothetical protein
MSRAITLAGYVLILVTALALEAGARRSPRLAPIGAVVTALTANRVVRVVLVTAWLWLGWHLFVRVDR